VSRVFLAYLKIFINIEYALKECLPRLETYEEAFKLLKQNAKRWPWIALKSSRMFKK